MGRDLTANLNRALEAATANGKPLFLRGDKYNITSFVMPEWAQLIGAPGQTSLRISGPGLMALGVRNVSVRHLTLESLFHDASDGEGLFHAMNARNQRLEDIEIIGRSKNGIRLNRTSGVIQDCRVSNAQFAAIRASDSQDLKIRDNRIADCGSHGIHVERSGGKAEDGTAITGNRIIHRVVGHPKFQGLR